MFITSSRFSPGAKEIADKFNIILIDGDDLIK
jgi:restriction endonuclease Mrr